ncbi:hypothetical protein GCM10018962_43270 [Dactylosporangium matsuzakiense]|uniref:Uncharacterized protein n=1 Tax=Dactylosporangium matsuzakiense TaxID=53360 RepID=A0A9W6KGX3_9ACTN|nr:hypothetical protein GCM10017581_015950 [Dactylosporangium matsuzakiense]
MYPLVAAIWMTGAFLSAGPARRDLMAVGLLSGIGFTVLPLIAELAFDGPGPAGGHARLDVLVASCAAATLLLRVRPRPAGGPAARQRQPQAAGAGGW